MHAGAEAGEALFKREAIKKIAVGGKKHAETSVKSEYAVVVDKNNCRTGKRGQIEIIQRNMCERAFIVFKN